MTPREPNGPRSRDAIPKGLSRPPLLRIARNPARKMAAMSQTQGAAWQSKQVISGAECREGRLGLGVETEATQRLETHESSLVVLAPISRDARLDPSGDPRYRLAAQANAQRSRGQCVGHRPIGTHARLRHRERAPTPSAHRAPEPVRPKDDAPHVQPSSVSDGCNLDPAQDLREHATAITSSTEGGLASASSVFCLRGKRCLGNPRSDGIRAHMSVTNSTNSDASESACRRWLPPIATARGHATSSMHRSEL